MQTSMLGSAHPLSGRWHLVGVDTPPGVVPKHRVDLIFRGDETGLRGAIQSHRGDLEFPLRFVTFDGTVLRLQMQPMSPPALAPRSADEPPVLLMAAVGDHFEGGWNTPEAALFRLKLVRATIGQT